jgi:hypothetical protein
VGFLEKIGEKQTCRRSATPTLAKKSSQTSKLVKGTHVNSKLIIPVLQFEVTGSPENSIMLPQPVAMLQADVQ